MHQYSESPIEWLDIYSEWKMLSMITAWKQNVSFTPVLVSSPSGGLRVGTEICDWWPKDEIAGRRTSLEKLGIMGKYWQTKKGTLRTAELLYDCQEDPEAQAAILVAASAWDKLHPLPVAWRGDVFGLIRSIFRSVISDSHSPFHKRSLSAWHHAMRNALPENIVTEEFAEFSKPRQFNDFVYIAFLEAILSTSLWNPVVVSHDRNPNS